MAQTKKILIVNRENNLGDAMCQMRALRDYKDKHPDDVLDFVTCYPLHWIAANHTDNFRKLQISNRRDLDYLADNFEEFDYDQVIEFAIDWHKAIEEGILKSWCETTLGFTPSSDKPYFLLTPEEKVTARAHYDMFRRLYDKLIIFQPQAVSGVERSFLESDWQKLYDMFPKEVGIVYAGPPLVQNPFKDASNLIFLPGYSLGVTAALMELVDCVFTVHSGFVMLAHAVNAKDIVHINFLEASGKGILRVTNGVNIDIPNNREVDWKLIQELINTHVGVSV